MLPFIDVAIEEIALEGTKGEEKIEFFASLALSLDDAPCRV